MMGLKTWLRLCFIVLFGTMSAVHGPVMTFSGAHAASGTHAAATAEHASHSADAAADCHKEQAPPAKHAECNAFACFMAVEPMPVMARPPLPVVFAVMAAAAMASFEPLRIAPALPPPRLQS